MSLYIFKNIKNKKKNEKEMGENVQENRVISRVTWSFVLYFHLLYTFFFILLIFFNRASCVIILFCIVVYVLHSITLH